QIVQGASTTQSGYDLLPFLIGLIVSSIITGQLISRTGHYKWLVVGSMGMLAFGLWLFTHLQADTQTDVLWAWMLIAGVGVGPSFAAFTLIVQNAVPFSRLGTATADLTLLRQIGVSVGLSVGFTVFSNNLTWDLLRTEIIAAGAPPAYVPATAPPGFNISDQLTQVGGDPLGAFMSQIPPAAQTMFLDGFHSAFSIALGNSMWVGVAAAVVAGLTTLFLTELPLRATHAPAAAEYARARVPGSTAPSAD
ncbi:MAG: MFS transporter, partial [Candidatus Limnocylindrales bacterium]